MEGIRPYLLALVLCSDQVGYCSIDQIARVNAGHAVKSVGVQHQPHYVQRAFSSRSQPSVLQPTMTRTQPASSGAGRKYCDGASDKNGALGGVYPDKIYVMRVFMRQNAAIHI